MTKQWQLSGNAESVDWSDLAMAGRAYADNLVGEPAVSKVMHMMADEIERLRSENVFRRRIASEFLRRPYCGQDCVDSQNDAKNDAIGLQSPAKTDTTQPRNGALSGGPDPDSRVFETQGTQPPHATLPQGSVQGGRSVRVSQNANEPVAWAALRDDGDIAWIGYTPEGAADGACGRRIVPLYRHPAPAVTAEPVAWWLRGPVAWWGCCSEYDTGCEYEYVSLVKESAEAAAKEGGTVTPLYAHPQPMLTEEEREAIQWAIDALVGIEDFAPGAVSADASAAATLRKLLERMA